MAQETLVKLILVIQNCPWVNEKDLGHNALNVVSIKAKIVMEGLITTYCKHKIFVL